MTAPVQNSLATKSNQTMNKKIPGNAHSRRRRYNMSYYAFMTIISCFFFYPMVWLIFSSFRENSAIFKTPFALPEQIRLQNWVDAWQIGHIGTYAKNSLIVTSITIVFILLFASLAAFAFSKARFKGSQMLMLMFVFGLFMPLQSFFIAQSYIFDLLHLKDTYWALILPYTGVGLPLAVFLLKAYLDALPKELMEAAQIDGCNEFSMFSRIVFPLLLPGMATVGIFSALNSWNELLVAMLYIQDDSLKTIPIGLLAFSSRYVTDYKLLFSALSLVTIPMIILYVFFHRYIIAGLTEGALK